MKIIKISIIAVVAVISLSPIYTRAQSQDTVDNPTRVIYIQNGGTVIDPNWNKGNMFVVYPYTNIDELDQAIIIAKNHFDKFNVLITTDFSEFTRFDVLHRTTIIVGSTDVLGKDTGYAFNNSYKWGKDTPGFVLTNNCNPKNMVSDIGHLIAHEAGHIFGLEHELNPTNSYYSVGFIMSNFTGKRFVVWSNNDTEVLTSVLGLKDSSDTLAYNNR